MNKREQQRHRRAQYLKKEVCPVGLRYKRRTYRAYRKMLVKVNAERRFSIQFELASIRHARKLIDWHCGWYWGQVEAACRVSLAKPKD